MKILFFNYEYPPLGAGAANATFCIMQEFSKMTDLEVDLVTSSIDGTYHLDRVGNNVRIHRLPIGKNEKNLHFQSQKDLLIYAFKAYFFSQRLIEKAMRENKAYNLTNSFFTVPCGYISYRLKKKYKIPYIVSLRGSDVPGFSDRFSLIYLLLKPLIKKIWAKSSEVVSASLGLKELALKTNHDQKIAIIFNGIDVEKFIPDHEKRPQDRLIITTGATRVTHRKCIDYLIRAVAKLAPKYPQIYAKIMGDGNAKEELEKLIDDLKIGNNVNLIGRIPREETAPYYQEASIFVLPSFNEGMSNAMLEALGSGLPIISTPTGGAEELVKDGINGYLIKYKDSDDIANKLETLLNNPELARKMGQESRKIAETMSWQGVAQKYFDLYKQVAR